MIVVLLACLDSLAQEPEPATEQECSSLEQKLEALAEAMKEVASQRDKAVEVAASTGQTQEVDPVEETSTAAVSSTEAADTAETKDQSREPSSGLAVSPLKSRLQP